MTNTNLQCLTIPAKLWTEVVLHKAVLEQDLSSTLLFNNAVIWIRKDLKNLIDTKKDSFDGPYWFDSPPTEKASCFHLMSLLDPLNFCFCTKFISSFLPESEDNDRRKNDLLLSVICFVSKNLYFYTTLFFFLYYCERN